jgi:hypothetical protein
MFRFSIRDVLWLTVVVGLAIGWGLDHWRLAHKAGEWEVVAAHVAEQYRMRTGQAFPALFVDGKLWPE